MKLSERIRNIKRDILALCFAFRHPQTPWYAKAICVLVAGYAISPIDLIPDFIPVLGYLDDALLLPLGIYLAVKMIPAPVLEECRAKALDWKGPSPKSRLAAILIIVIWIVGMVFIGKAVCPYLAKWNLF